MPCDRCIKKDVCYYMHAGYTGCIDHFAPDTTNTAGVQINEAKAELVQALIQSPLGQSMIKLLDIMVEAIDNQLKGGKNSD